MPPAFGRSSKRPSATASCPTRCKRRSSWPSPWRRRSSLLLERPEILDEGVDARPDLLLAVAFPRPLERVAPHRHVGAAVGLDHGAAVDRLADLLRVELAVVAAGEGGQVGGGHAQGSGDRPVPFRARSVAARA